MVAIIRICPNCKKDGMEFGINKGRRNGYQHYCKKCSRIKVNAIKKKDRIRVIEFLGNRCKKCGFANALALQIDHINGGGRKDRARYKNDPSNFYRAVLKDKKNKYQLLCANCNQIKRSINKED